MTKKENGKDVLKICAVLCTIGLVLMLICNIVIFTHIIPELNTTLVNELKAELQPIKDIPNWILEATLIALTIFYSFITLLMWRAVKDPKKTTLLLLLIIVSLVINIIPIFLSHAGILLISSIIWDCVILIGLICKKNNTENKDEKVKE